MEYFYKSIVGSSGLNGDKYFVSEENNVFAISDGSSGAFDKVGASLCCINPLEDLDYKSSNMSPFQYINHCINTANNKLIEKSQNEGKLSFGTMTMSVFHKDTLYIGAVGDSPAFFIKNDTITRLIKPKKRYSNAVEYGVITEEEAKKAVLSLPGPLQSNFDNFLPMIVPEIATNSIKVDEGDILFICCDGISDWVKPHELVQILRSTSNLEAVCEDIFSKVEARCPKDCLDDRTIVSVEF